VTALNDLESSFVSNHLKLCGYNTYYEI